MSRQRTEIVVEPGAHGRWEAALPDDHQPPVICETFDDARMIAYLYAARGGSCELIVRDAYHRVTGRERIPARSTRRRRTTRTRRPAILGGSRPT